jgi:hypothetical protein
MDPSLSEDSQVPGSYDHCNENFTFHKRKAKSSLTIRDPLYGVLLSRLL